MSLSSRREAVRHIRDSIQLAVSCVTDRVVHTQPSRLRLLNATSETLMVALSGGDPTTLVAEEPLLLKVQCLVNVGRRLGDSGSLWSAHIAGYFYELRASAADEIASYHLHPSVDDGMSRPHLHIGIGATGAETRSRSGRFHKIHFPTEVIAVEDVIQLAIVEFGARPRRPDWAAVLDATRRMRANT